MKWPRSIKSRRCWITAVDPIEVKNILPFIDSDSTDLKFQEVIEGNLIQILDEVQFQLNHKFLVRPIDFVGMQRLEKDEYPVDALREMLLNALVHRTYMGAHVQLRVYNDRLSIWNEGGLPFGLRLEELKREHNSRPRNPKIAKACFMAGYIDTWGRGTLKIINSCKEAGLPEPDIMEKDGGFMVALHKAALITNEGGQIGGQIGNIDYDITERQAAVLKLIQDNKKISRKKIGEILGIAESAIQKHTDALQQKGIIERVAKHVVIGK